MARGTAYGFIALAAALVWFSMWEPIAAVSVIGVAGLLIGGWQIYKEAFESAVMLEVYEYGAGYQRSRYESERNEKARRFRFKYGSGDDLQSNVAPHFIGVFDTVASLAATGVRR